MRDLRRRAAAAPRAEQVSRRLGLLEVLTEEFRALHPEARCDADNFEALYRSIHALPRPRSALCLSGGGIRSASFALGVLQALARHGLLFGFDYLSTVSGGGYIGAWLSAWRHHAGDDATVLHGLTTRNIAPPEEPPELRGLRASSNFLTPRRGALSADTWTAVALFIRNLLLNWTVFLPLFAAVVLVPIGAAEFVGWAPLWPRIWPLLFVGIAAALLIAGLAHSLASRSGADGQGIDQGQYLRRILLPLYVAATLLCAVALHPEVVDAAVGWSGWLGYGAGCGALIYAVSWWIAFASRPREFGRLALRGSPRDPVPALQLFAYWVLTGAAAGAMLALGYNLWLGTRGSLGYAEWVGTDWVKNLLVAGGVGWVTLAVLLGDTLYVGLASYARDGDTEREWRARSSGWLVAVNLLWTILSAIILFGPQELESAWKWGLAAAGGTASGLVSVLFSSSARSAATSGRQLAEKWPVTLTVSIATLIFLPLLAILVAGGSRAALDAVEKALSPSDYRFYQEPGLRLLATSAAGVACLLTALAASWYINVNRFSLHAVYRNRLIRGFLGSARAGGRRPDRFTGFDIADNLPVAALWPPPPGAGRRLFPVINTALNVVAGTNLAWQERKAEAFVITPLAAGNPRVRFRPTRFYGGANDGLTLGTAMAISGAAISPNQGYHSSPLVSILMMLANVRLGWWLGNPRNDATASREGPRFSFVPIVNEMFGLTTDTGKYVYLSDGGHFENLGLYEMVRRRCRFIVVSDAGCDPDYQFEDLGNAVRKIWIDLGVAIRFRAINLTARKPEPTDGIYCAIADICYPEPEAGPGHLVYIKPGYHGTEPADVRSYASLNPSFPHETTANQWFTESQMESYRVLGGYIVDLICQGAGAAATDPCHAIDEPVELPDFLARAEAYLQTRLRQP
ncbi:MAG: patatin-like phospholipase family protein [Alphaproteobacteria bacterium]|nr:patatin-like phospholipase family protein [Alphaproteobacteria bacterium]MBV9863147.1 patatin-like phospholipase family protein [Alphaproteobacteria bacterium]